MYELSNLKWHFENITKNALSFKLTRSLMKKAKLVIKKYKYKYKYDPDVDDLQSIIKTLDDDIPEMRKEVVCSIMRPIVDLIKNMRIKICDNYIMSIYAVSRTMSGNAIAQQNYCGDSDINNFFEKIRGSFAIQTRRELVNNEIFQMIVPRMFMQAPFSMIIELAQLNKRFKSYRMYDASSFSAWVDPENYDRASTFLLRKIANFNNDLSNIAVEFSYNNTYNMSKLIRFYPDHEEFDW